VSVLDMASAYATLANNGAAIEPTTIDRVTLPNGEVVRPDQEVLEAAVSPGVAYLVTRALEEVMRRGTGTGAQIGRPAAGKTGTTNDHADAWFVGYTPDLVTAVWVGYPQGRIPMYGVNGVRVFGGTYPAYIWRAFMEVALAGRPAVPFERPIAEFVNLRVDPKTGLRAAKWCPGKRVLTLAHLAPAERCPAPPEPEKKPKKKKDRDEEDEREDGTRRDEERDREDDDERDDASPSPSPTARPTPRATESPGTKED
jgi:penicillin-binding protein 1A